MSALLVPPLDIPSAWAQSAAEILQRRWHTILVLGAADRGKSSYCRFLVHHCLTAGQRVALLDADVGQKAIGPPATLTLGYPQPEQLLDAVPPAAWYFVGATTPVGHLLPVIVGVRHLLDTARATYRIVNTTGFVQGVGRVLKSYKIEAVQPDVIIALEHGRELRALLQPYQHCRILYLPTSAQAAVKHPAQRQAARQRAFGAYFTAARPVELPLRQVLFQRGRLFTGRRVAHPDFVYAERTPEGFLAVGSAAQAAHDSAHVLPVGFERSLLCGVADRRNVGLGLAIVQHIDFARETLALYTPVPAAQIRVLQWGGLYVQPDGREGGPAVPRALLG